MPEEKVKLKNLEERIDAAKDQMADKNSPNIMPSQLGKVIKFHRENIWKNLLNLKVEK